MVSHNLLREPIESRDASDRRRYARHALEGRCWLESDELTLWALTADIGRGGLFVRTAVPMLKGSEVEISLRVRGQTEALCARAVITRAVPARGGARHGVGVEFVKILRGEPALLELNAQPGLLGFASARL